MKIVVRAPNWIGDSVLALPSLLNLKRNYPEAQIWVAAHDWVKGLFSMDTLNKRVIPVPGKLDLKNLRSLAQQLKEMNFDTGILLTNSFASALLFYLAKIPQRWGYKKDGRSLLLTRGISAPPQEDVHQVRYYLNLLSGLGLREYTTELNLQVPQKERQKAEACLKEMNIEPKKALVIINPGATFGRAKQWPSSKYADLSTLLKEKAGAQIIIIGSSGETRLAHSISSGTRHQPVVLSGKTSLPQLAAIISLANLIVTNDSGPMHLANALKIPTVALFGPTDPNRTRPYQHPYTLIHKGAPCWPCSYRECPYDHRCMMNISVDETFQACKEFLQ